ncbi:MFS transporter [Streptomyces sp. FXJ1.172]|uniref:MFS transporter n=1 Tax=Streptomyces sp. FXJ1.172 TaxID=710705 RepID=UPI0007CF6034|nr:MFS transporter [Streptomyces sp. FXJ1.172]WEO93115.1 MFS transporter [Streptomyces sp. FXJ1.172]
MAGAASLPVILAVVVSGAAATAVFSTAEHAAVRNLVSLDRLTTAVARNEARTYGVSLAGPPLGGLLFGIGRALPFADNALSFLLSLVAVLCIRRPLQQDRHRPSVWGFGLGISVQRHLVLRPPGHLPTAPS